jgi:O-antigen/teichoic acid export membrane protein
MRAERFVTGTIQILGTRIGNLAVRFVYSILLARMLGPEGKGIYSLVLIFSGLFVTFLSFGLGPATVYFTAKGAYPRKTVLENSSLAILILGIAGIALGVVVLLATGQMIYPEIPRQLLFLSLLLIPLNLFNKQLATQYLLGINRIDRYNLSGFGSVFIPFVFFLVSILLFGRNLTAVIWSRVIGLTFLAGLLYYWLRQSVGGFSFDLNRGYIKDVYQYGIKAYFANIIGFLNYRVELFLLGYYLPLSTAGYYAVAVGLAEMLWLVSQSAGTMIFPMVSAEQNEERKKTITPLVMRTVLGITLLGAVILYLLADFFIPLVYSNLYDPSVPLFKILLPGIVFVSGSRVLANDIAGRGKPILNTYVGGVGFLIQLVLNLSLIPVYGAIGAAWASTTAYLFLLVVRLAVYMRISGNNLRSVILPQKKDWDLYWRLIVKIWNDVKQWLKKEKKSY